jgi:hypothetical protein
MFHRNVKQAWSREPWYGNNLANEALYKNSAEMGKHGAKSLIAVIVKAKGCCPETIRRWVGGSVDNFQ